MPAVSRPTAPAAPSAAQKALQKMGLRRDIDLALHLPLRWEDETRLTPLAALQDGMIAQVEGVHAKLYEEALEALESDSGELVFYVCPICG